MIKSNLNLAFIAASPKEQEAEWIKALKSEDASLKAKADACRELAVLGSKEAIAPSQRCFWMKNSPTWHVMDWNPIPTRC